VSTLVTLHAGHDVTYFTSGQGSGGCAGAMSYYTAAGEPPGEWAGKGAATLGLAGQIDPDVIGRLYQHNIGPSGELLVKKRRSKAAGDREQAAVTAYLAAHPYASATELAEVRAAEHGQDPPQVPYFDLTVSAVKSVSVLHASYRVSARQARGRGQDARAAALDARADELEDALTGESVPADAAEGDAVTGGTIALTGRLVVRADKVGRDTQLAHLIAMVEQAQAGQAGIQRIADRICAVFVPAVLACSALTLAGWLLAGAPAGRAVSAALAVLIIACPCALGLATPAALVVASGRGAQLGIFIKGYQALESSRGIDTVVLDKTGTLTTGQMTVTAVRAVPGTSRAELLRYAGSVEQASEHAVAAAITAQAAAESARLADAAGFAALPGLGARGVVDGHQVVIGRAALIAGQGVGIPAGLAAWCREREEGGATTVLVAWDQVTRGAFAVTGAVKPSAAAVARLRGLGLRTVLLTGDNAATARAVAGTCGIDEVISEALPAAKARVITELRAAGRCVAMVGDGVNDGPALAAAQLGLALGSGTDVAICAADMILLRDDLGAVPDAIALARATFTTIRRNLAWAFCYNVLALPLAALGFLNPLIAATTMTLSSVFVVWNSLRLRRTAARPGRSGETR
jgi:Cu+-exporting ATPase